MDKSNENIKIIDFFCGIGGLTHGLINAGLNVVAGIDNDERCRFAYQENNKGATFISQKIEDVPIHELNKHLAGAKWKVVVGCAPCQPFSSYTVKARRTVKNTGNWNLINNFMSKIREIKPDVVSMENVPHITKQQVYADFLNELESMDYYVSANIVNCADYGIPQSRRRLVLLASKHGKIELPPATKRRKTLRDAIGEMPRLSHGEQCLKDPLHKSSMLFDINLQRIRASKSGGTWLDWPKKLLPECYKKESGLTYKNVYGRLVWDNPAPTMTGQFMRYGTGRFGHPSQDRALSLREGALIQTFPMDYRFVPKNGEIKMGVTSTHIGNAVPVDLGKIIGKTILKHIQEEDNNG